MDANKPSSMSKVEEDEEPEEGEIQDDSSPEDESIKLKGVVCNKNSNLDQLDKSIYSGTNDINLGYKSNSLFPHNNLSPAFTKGQMKLPGNGGSARLSGSVSVPSYREKSTYLSRNSHQPGPPKTKSPTVTVPGVRGGDAFGQLVRERSSKQANKVDTVQEKENRHGFHGEGNCRRKCHRKRGQSLLTSPAAKSDSDLSSDHEQHKVLSSLRRKKKKKHCSIKAHVQSPAKVKQRRIHGRVKESRMVMSKSTAKVSLKERLQKMIALKLDSKVKVAESTSPLGSEGSCANHTAAQVPSHVPEQKSHPEVITIDDSDKDVSVSKPGDPVPINRSVSGRNVSAESCDDEENLDELRNFALNSKKLKSMKMLDQVSQENKVVSHEGIQEDPKQVAESEALGSDEILQTEEAVKSSVPLAREDEEVLQLRLIALHSAFMKKHQDRVQRGLQLKSKRRKKGESEENCESPLDKTASPLNSPSKVSACGELDLSTVPLPGTEIQGADEMTPVDMDLAHTDDEQSSELTSDSDAMPTTLLISRELMELAGGGLAGIQPLPPPPPVPCYPVPMLYSQQMVSEYLGQECSETSAADLDGAPLPVPVPSLSGQPGVLPVTTPTAVTHVPAQAPVPVMMPGVVPETLTFPTGAPCAPEFPTVSLVSLPQPAPPGVLHAPLPAVHHDLQNLGQGCQPHTVAAHMCAGNTQSDQCCGVYAGLWMNAEQGVSEPMLSDSVAQPNTLIRQPVMSSSVSTKSCKLEEPLISSAQDTNLTGNDELQPAREVPESEVHSEERTSELDLGSMIVLDEAVCQTSEDVNTHFVDVGGQQGSMSELDMSSMITLDEVGQCSSPELLAPTSSGTTIVLEGKGELCTPNSLGDIEDEEALRISLLNAQRRKRLLKQITTTTASQQTSAEVMPTEYRTRAETLQDANQSLQVTRLQQAAAQKATSTQYVTKMLKRPAAVTLAADWKGNLAKRQMLKQNVYRPVCAPAARGRNRKFNATQLVRSSQSRVSVTDKTSSLQVTIPAGTARKVQQTAERFVIALGPDSDSSEDETSLATRQCRVQEVPAPLSNIPPDFEQKVDMFLKQARKKQEEMSASAERSVQTPKKMRTAVCASGDTPVAVRSLPAFKVEEYRRLKQQEAELMRQKQQRVQEHSSKLATVQSNMPTSIKVTFNSEDQKKSVMRYIKQPAICSTTQVSNTTNVPNAKVRATSNLLSSETAASETTLQSKNIQKDLQTTTLGNLLMTTSSAIDSSQKVKKPADGKVPCSVSASAATARSQIMRTSGASPSPVVTRTFQAKKPAVSPVRGVASSLPGSRKAVSPASMPKATRPPATLKNCRTPSSPGTVVTDLPAANKSASTPVSQQVFAQKDGERVQHKTDVQNTSTPAAQKCGICVDTSPAEKHSAQSYPVCTRQQVTTAPAVSIPPSVKHSGPECTVITDSGQNDPLSSTTQLNCQNKHFPTSQVQAHQHLANCSSSKSVPSPQRALEKPVILKQEVEKRCTEAGKETAEEEDGKECKKSILVSPKSNESLEASLGDYERKLLSQRCSVLSDLTEILQLLCNVEEKTNQKEKYWKEVQLLRAELQRAEQCLSREEEELARMRLHIAQSYHRVISGRAECVKLAKKCYVQGTSLKGRKYRVPAGGAVLMNSKLQQVSQRSRRLAKRKEEDIDGSPDRADTLDCSRADCNLLQAGFEQCSPIKAKSAAFSPPGCSVSTKMNLSPNSQSLFGSSEPDCGTKCEDVFSDSSSTVFVEGEARSLKGSTETQFPKGAQPDMCSPASGSVNAVEEFRQSCIAFGLKTSLVNRESSRNPCSVPLHHTKDIVTSNSSYHRNETDDHDPVPVHCLSSDSSNSSGFVKYVSPLEHLRPKSHSEHLDNMKFLCPYELDGTCQDDECQYQHMCQMP